MVMSSSAPLPVGVVIDGGDRRQRSTTAFTATTLASLFLLTTTLLRSSFPTVATAFSVHNSATAVVVVAFRQPNSITSNRTARRFLPGDSSQLLLHSSRHNDDDAYAQLNYCRRRHNTLVAIAIASTQLLFSPILSSNPMAFAYNYDESDKYASETVTNVVTKLQGSAGDVDATFNTLEEVAKIITEGKGVGGTLTYDGIKLNEGFVADEDTTIYNPGLTLLTSSEKERLVNAIVDNRQIGLSTQHWSENNEYAFDFLKQKLDPLHMHELEGYLAILPFYGAALYLVALFVQKNVRGIFPLVYGLCALGVFGPVLLLVATGP